MARWTQTYADVVHMATVPKELPIAGIVSIRLKNGAAIEGVIRRMSFGNNAGEGGWRYYGEYELESISGGHHIIDVLDIDSAQDLWHSHKDAYEAAGLIVIVDSL